MFDNDLIKNHELLDATFEILIMLAGAFLLGALFCWAMGKLRGSKNNRRARYQRKTVDHQNGFRQPVQQAGVAYPDEAYSNDHALKGTEVATAHAEIPSTSSPAIKSSPEETTSSAIISKKIIESDLVIIKNAETTKSAIIKPSSDPVTTIDIASEIGATGAAVSTSETDDFKKIEGIDSKIENTLHIAGVKTYADLRASSYDTLKKILSSANLTLKSHDPETWPYQADLAYNNKWTKLQEYQDFLMGGEK
jgi:predicted flap endonuclease-1-like 5' DNA nuclease